MLDSPKRIPAWREIGAQIFQLGCAALGGYAFAWVGVPAGWLSGAVVVSIVFVMIGRARPLPPLLADLAMLLAGVSMGAGATPEAIAAMSRYPASLVAPFSLLVPIFGMSSGAVLLGEPLGPLRIAAAGLVLAGLAIILLPSRAPAPLETSKPSQAS